ncbi:ECF transporter S component [Clostridium rectalis]|uniref:ECF transporter S component n=1 Tax=Clostridium rectalis TaxID=2040295 RepID=UPI000F637A74|nr:ECF transporter S component [Clostridium rectalis]
MKKNSTFHLIIIALCTNINIAGSFVAANLKLPVYLDAIGTIVSTFLMGTPSGIITGILTSIVASTTFDPISFFFIPVQIVLAIVSGFLYNKKLFNYMKLPLGITMLSFAVSFTSAPIATLIFNGITSSGSSYIVAFLRGTGLNLFTSVFSVQFFSDILDKTIAILIAMACIKYMPLNIKVKLK